MATLAASGFPLLVDVVKTKRPDGSPESVIADILSLKMAIMDDIPWEECNGIVSHRITDVNGLPSPEWTAANQGVSGSYATTEQYDEQTGVLEQLLRVEAKAMEYGGKQQQAAYRALQNRLFIEGFQQEFERAFFYESVLTNPTRIHGLASRYPATTGFIASGYTLKGTNAGVNAQSVWLLNWGLNKIYGIYPQGMAAGLQHDDLGINTDTLNGKSIRAYRDWYIWRWGLAVADYRHGCRYQWDPDDANFADTGKGMYLALQNQIGTVYDMDQSERARFYGSRKSFNKLNAQLVANEANPLTYIEIGKRRVFAFEGVPYRITDRLIDESAIS